jgi:hypothetical protein
MALGIWHLNGMDWPEPKAPRCGRKSRRMASSVERRTSRTCYRISRKSGKALTTRYPRGIDILNMHTMEDAVRRHDGRVMRSGKTEDAMSGAGMIGIAGRQLRSPLAVVLTKLKSRRAITGSRRWREPSKRDQQTLRGHRIGDDDDEQRPPEAIGSAEFYHPAAPRRSLALKGPKGESTPSIAGNQFGRSMWH